MMIKSTNLFFKVSSGINWRALLQVIILILVCAMAIYFTQDKIHFKEMFTAPVSMAVKAPTFRFETIELPQALQYFNKNEAIFLDVRAKQFYDYGHIERAVNLPIETIPQLAQEQINQWKEAPAVLIYCNGVSCGSGYMVARLLMEKGLDNVKIYIEGWPEWRSCKLPITMSAQMKLDLSKEKE